MDALNHLVNNIPDWLKRLDELNGQIEQRQIELAKLTDSHISTSPVDGSPIVRSIRNKGSTESLKPRDEPAAHPREATPQPPSTSPESNDAALVAAQAAGAAAATAVAQGAKHPASSPAESHSPSAVQRQTNQVRAAGQARARATLRKRQRTGSIISAEGAAPQYHTRTMIIVYYDSYVQSFFEELVKFVSASRNMMRKAKMAAKVAQIKRLAELEMPDDSGDDNDEDDGVGKNSGEGGAPLPDLGAVTAQHPPAVASSLMPGSSAPLIEPWSSKDGDEETPPLRYVSTRRMQAMPRITSPAAGLGMYSRAGARGPGAYRAAGMGSAGLVKDQQPDIYDGLDKGLEYVQSMCEHAAHQFLRDGDCGEEVGNIQQRMAETNEMASKELERVKKEDPDAFKAADESLRGRSYRPQSMRKMGAVSAKGPPAPAVGDAIKLEVDEGFEEQEFVPQLVYKSTRGMR
ncbi:hypothetical protein B0T19DRAFT_227883 [Cercophora scortea]|uniref:Uncharacterized protein n=1 Tax=Cercophora scortea TaxID=314031 RepID=A0AAE0M9V6_9PEZI|nr:hypothetical protein B0T19DRAFT_227883 [Cercophora scortea]